MLHISFEDLLTFWKCSMIVYPQLFVFLLCSCGCTGLSPSFILTLRNILKSAEFKGPFWTSPFQSCLCSYMFLLQTEQLFVARFKYLYFGQTYDCQILMHTSFAGPRYEFSLCFAFSFFKSYEVCNTVKHINGTALQRLQNSPQNPVV